MNTQDLVPKHKEDIETAQLLFSHTYEKVQAIIPALLEWLKDMNWPVARPVAAYLVSVSEHITAEILTVLQGEDEIWKYWCIQVFGVWSDKKMDPLLRNEIMRIIAQPTAGEIHEEVVEIAKEAMTTR